MIKKTVRSATRSYCVHGCATRRAGEVRASAPIRALVAVIAALLAVQLMPVVAYADGINAQIISGPSLTPIDNMIGASIAAPDRYVAAALLIGYSPDTISSWDDDIKAKLSNEQTGGSFYSFAENSVQNYYDVTEHTGIFKTFLDYVGGTFWNMAETLYGNNLWAALYTSQEFESAARDLATVLNGGNIGGGGSAADGDYYVFDFKPIGPVLSGVSSVYVSKSVVSFQGATVGFEDAIKSGCICVYPSTNGTTRVYMTVLYFSSEVNPTYGLTDNLQNYDYMYFDVSKGQYVDCSNSHTYTGRIEGDKFYIDYDGYQYPETSFESRSYRRSLYYQYSYGAGILQTNTVAPVPPTNWPDQPSAPSPPELPEPGTDPTVTPTPWAPVISPTFDFDLNITTEPTSNDQIDWVKKIYYELRLFHSDEQDWFDEVGKGIDGLVKAVNNAQRQIYSELQTIDDTLHDEGQKIRDYMYQMFHWLKDQLNFQNNTFDDNNIVYWLKRIWSKLGSGDINLRPTDPTTEPDNWWDWLVKAIQNFLIGLAATSTELISEIADLASQVMHEFPFSIPWDIAAVLAALSTAPITPVFTITVPAVDGWWASFDFVIDMSPFDGAAETIRLMEKLLFTGLLIWKSKDLLDFMDVTKWFN